MVRQTVPLLVFCLMRTWTSDKDDAMLSYLFDGMQQERVKITSGRYEIEQTSISDGFSKSVIEFSGSNIRLRTEFPEDNKRKPIRACDDGVTIAYWDQSNPIAELWKSGTRERQRLKVWDPRSAGIILVNETDYQKALELRKNNWKGKCIVENRGSIRIVTFTRDHGDEEARLSITIDADCGFTPVEYHGERVVRLPEPGKTKSFTIYHASAKWEKHKNTWVPVHHQETDASGKVAKEYKLKWESVNTDVEARQFKVESIGLPSSIKLIDFRNISPTKLHGDEIEVPVSHSEATGASSKWWYWIAAAVLIALLAGHGIVRRKKG